MLYGHLSHPPPPLFPVQSSHATDETGANHAIHFELKTEIAKMIAHGIIKVRRDLGRFLVQVSPSSGIRAPS